MTLPLWPHVPVKEREIVIARLAAPSLCMLMRNRQSTNRPLHDPSRPAVHQAGSGTAWWDEA